MDELEFWSLHWRQERDSRLQACDWVMLSDVPDTTTDKPAWLEYRQALRDVPQQSGFPFNISWPVQPSREN